MIDDIFEQDVIIVAGIFLLVCLSGIWVLNFGCMSPFCKEGLAEKGYGSFAEMVLGSALGMDIPNWLAKVIFTIISIPLCLGFANYFINK